MGFLIDAVAYGIDFPPEMDARNGFQRRMGVVIMRYIQMCNLAEIIVRTIAAG
jgi:hypothetical protein